MPGSSILTGILPLTNLYNRSETLTPSNKIYQCNPTTFTVVIFWYCGHLDSHLPRTRRPFLVGQGKKPECALRCELCGCGGSNCNASDVGIWFRGIEIRSYESNLAFIQRYYSSFMNYFDETSEGLPTGTVILSSQTCQSSIRNLSLQRPPTRHPRLGPQLPSSLSRTHVLKCDIFRRYELHG
jgi:hypothetical protein